MSKHFRIHKEAWVENEIKIFCSEFNRYPNEWKNDPKIKYINKALRTCYILHGAAELGVNTESLIEAIDRLAKGKPLTPIVDVDDVWFDGIKDPDGSIKQCCKRMDTLYKIIYPNGLIRYIDTGRIVGVPIEYPNVQYYNGVVTRIIDEMFPIVMPYYPATEPYKVYTEDFLVDPKNGDFDTKGLFYVVTPTGERIEINRYFKSSNGSMEEITEKEYLERKEISKREDK